MRNFYNKMKSILEKIDYDTIYPGFHRFSFALYNDKMVWLEDGEMDRTDDFFGNTSIEFEGMQLAIWHVDFDTDEADLEWFAADLVHEMFHAYQREASLVTVWPQDLKLLQYPDDLINYTMKRQENLLLASALEASMAERKRILQTVSASRQLRAERIGDFIDQEILCEELEGGAESAGCLALKQLNVDKYMKRLKGCSELLAKEDSSLFDIRRMSYFSGTIIKILEREQDQSKTLVEDLFDKYMQEKEEKINSFMAGNPKKYQVDTFICGYDPMNQIRLGDRIYASHIMFLMINNEPVRLDGPVVLDMKPGSNNEVEAYYIM